MLVTFYYDIFDLFGVWLHHHVQMILYVRVLPTSTLKHCVFGLNAFIEIVQCWRRVFGQDNIKLQHDDPIS